MHTFVLIAYFFVACFLTHQQLIHEVSLTVADGRFMTDEEKKTSCHVTQQCCTTGYLGVVFVIM